MMGLEWNTDLFEIAVGCTSAVVELQGLLCLFYLQSSLIDMDNSSLEFKPLKQ